MFTLRTFLPLTVLAFTLAGCASEPDLAPTSFRACAEDNPLFVAYNECQSERAFDQFHLMRPRETN